VSIFDLETMITSLLTDPTLMQPKNIAPGYNIFTGRSVGCQDGRYGKSILETQGSLSVSISVAITIL
jgi:hypothetical protein